MKYLSEIETLKRKCEESKAGPAINMIKALIAKVIRNARRFLWPGSSADMSGSDEKLLNTSSLFDANFYLSTYPDVANAGMDAVKHYLEYGGIEGRQPSENFDGAAYLRKYDDVRQAGLNPLVHYLRYGRTEGRNASPSVGLNVQSAGAQKRSAEREKNRLPLNQPRPLEARRIIRDSGLFDAEFYCNLYPDIDPKKIDPFEHYFNYGGTEGRRPSPFFDGGRYVAQYPDVNESGMHPLVHYLTIGKAEGRIAGPTQNIISTATRMIEEAALIEPTILLESSLDEPQFLPVNFGGEGWSRLTVWQKLFESIDHAYDCLIFVPWLVRGGADLAAVNAVKASVENLGLDSVLLVLTDYDRKDAIDWLPGGTHVRVFSDFDINMGRADRTLMTELLIRAVRPKSVLNVNSGACWDAMVQKGGALSKVCDLYAFLFCRDYTADGRPAGYADTHFRAALPFLRKAYFDNSGFMKELARDFGIPVEFKSRLVTLHQPISVNSGGSHNGGPEERNKVFWASRFSKQKNVELLIKIVEAAPNIDFDLYGYGDLYYVNLLESGAKRLPNLNLKGRFSSISELPINDYNALLYTSLWDGLPLTLVDLAAMGVPIVASSVGGIPDFVDVDTGWAIEAYEDPMHYVQALQYLLHNPNEARLRSARMVERVTTAHSWQLFKSTLSVRPSFAI